MSVSFSSDDDGFFRRECPHCLQEFKWLKELNETSAEDLLLHCPYCGDAIKTENTWTQAQFEYARNTVYYQVVKPALEDFGKNIGASNSFLKNSVTQAKLPEGQAPFEPNDMKRFDFPCHPKTPAKILDNWELPVHCIVCGQAYKTATPAT